MGNDIKIKANINRNLRVAGNSIDLSGVTINGNAYILTDKIIFDDDTKILGKLVYDKETKVINIEKATIEKTVVKEYKNTNNNVISKPNFFRTTFYNFIISVTSSFIVLVVLFHILPSSKEKLNKLELKLNPIVKYIVIGLCVLIIIPFILLIMLLSGILRPLGFIILFIYIISIYLSNLLVYYLVGNVINTKLIKNNNTYLSIIIGVIVVKLIKLIPAIGGLITMLSLFMGLGLIFNYVKPKTK
jgi:hypothetical protein